MFGLSLRAVLPARPTWKALPAMSHLTSPIFLSLAAIRAPSQIHFQECTSFPAACTNTKATRPRGGRRSSPLTLVLHTAFWHLTRQPIEPRDSVKDFRRCSYGSVLRHNWLRPTTNSQ